MNKYIALLRPQQWYKNLLVFCGLFFSQNFFEPALFLLCLQGFVVLCILSSANYIVNDIVDYKKDRLHAQKRHRPLANGSLSLGVAIVLSIVLFALSLGSAYILGSAFFLCALVLALATSLYSLHFKNVIFLDVSFISVNFLLRSLAGIALIGVFVTNWFLLGIYFLAFFLVLGKRYGEVCGLDAKTKKYKPVLELYNRELVLYMLAVFLALLMLIYGLYMEFSSFSALVYIYPLYVYVLLRYFYLIYTNHPGIRNPETFLTKNNDFALLTSVFLFILCLFVVFYGGAL